jgi:predicted Zn-dependent peptidase
MKRFTLLVVLVAAGFMPVFAQNFNPITFEEYKLDNGLTVILHVDRTAPTAMTYCLYKVGSKDERTGLTGFAHFFEHLMFEGTEHIKRGSIDKMITAAGGVLNASTSFDQTDYFFKVPINQLELALWIESERMKSLVIDSIGIETQRGVVKEELKQRYEGRPYGTLFDNLFRNTFKGTQYEWTPIGNPEDINRASREQFMQFHDKFYLPNNACLAVGGDLDIEQTKAWIEKYFGPIPAGPDPQRIPVTIPKQTEPREMTVEEEVTPLPAYVESYITVPTGDPDEYALDFLASALSSGESSRLYQRLVDQDQIALQAASFPMNLEKTGMLAFYCIANQGVDFETIEKTIAEEIDKVKTDGITEEEFQKLRNSRETSLTRRYSDLDSKVRSLAWYSMFYGDTKAVNKEFDKYMAVTRDDVKRVANKYLRPNRMNVVKYFVVDRAN